MSFTSWLNRYPDRPVQATYAVILLYAALAADFLFYAVRLLFFFTPDVSIPDGVVTISVIVAGVTFLLQFLIVVKIAAGRNWARWLLLVFFALDLLSTSLNIDHFLSSLWISLPGIIQLTLAAIAIGLLFQPRPSAWFTAKDPDEKEAAIQEDSAES